MSSGVNSNDQNLKSFETYTSHIKLFEIKYVNNLRHFSPPFIDKFET